MAKLTSVTFGVAWALEHEGGEGWGTLRGGEPGKKNRVGNPLTVPAIEQNSCQRVGS